MGRRGGLASVEARRKSGKMSEWATNALQSRRRKKAIKKTKEMSEIKALIYCRVSSERQKTEGHGLDSQEQRCRLYCEQKGYEVEGQFEAILHGIRPSRSS